MQSETSLVVQWLRLWAFTEGDLRLIPGPEKFCMLCDEAKIKKDAIWLLSLLSWQSPMAPYMSLGEKLKTFPAPQLYPYTHTHTHTHLWLQSLHYPLLITPFQPRWSPWNSWNKPSTLQLKTLPSLFPAYGIFFPPTLTLFFYFLQIFACAVLCFVNQLHPALCHPMDCSPPSSSVHGDSPGRNTGGGCHALFLKEIFPTQGLNPGLLHGSQILLPSEQAGKPKNTEADSLSLFQGSSQPRNQMGVSCTASRFFTSWAIREAPVFA